MPFHVVVKTGATIPDTLNLIVKAINVCEHSPFVIRLTQRLRAQNPSADKYTFIKNVFDYVCNNVKYKLDNAGDEEVWTPEKTVREGVGDCKKMTVLIASILKCAGIEPVCKHVYYKNELHTHIYVIVPFPTLNNYLTVDPVNHKQWNKEVEHSRASLHFLNGKIMDLHMMGNVPSKRRNFSARWGAPINQACRNVDSSIKQLAGVGCGVSGNEKENVLAQSLMGDFAITGIDDDEIINGMGAIGKRKSRANRGAQKEKRKARRQKLFHVFKAVNLAPSRASFLLLVRSNIFQLAARMAKSWIHNPDGLKKVWAQFGGKPEKLKEAIKAGAGRKHKELASKVQGMGTIPSVAELEAMETQGVGFPPAIAAAIAAATPIVLAIIKVIGKSKHDQDTDDSSNAEDIAEGVQQGAEAYADSQSDEATEGIGYMDDADEIVSGEDYDYIDGMGKKRKKDKSARKAKKAAKKAEKKAKRASKKSKGEDDATEEGGLESDSYADVPEETIKKAKKKARITNDDIKALSTLAEYGTRKILKGQVKVKEINDIIKSQDLPDDEGTLDTPRLPALATAEKDDISIPKENNLTNPASNPPSSTSPSAGSTFGLQAINSLPTFLHWFRGAMTLLLIGSLGLEVLTSTIVIGSFVWLTRSYTFSFTKKFTSWLRIGKQ